jgi:leucyl-tRNA synthetase
LAAFIEECKTGGTTEAELATQEKKGMATGLFVTHPLTGAQVGVWVGNYVLMSYGDGAVMGVPAHDERDFAFALKYGIEIRQVVGAAEWSSAASTQGVGASTIGTGHTLTPPADTPTQHASLVGDKVFDATLWHDWYADKSGALVCVNSGELDGLPFKAAVSKVAELLAAKGLGEKKTTWRLRDWGVSRQRYWGTPIPIIHCDEHGAVPVPEKDLPVVLPQDCIPDGSGNPLHKHEGFHAGVTFLVLHAVLRPQERRRHGGWWSRLLDAHGPVHRRYRACHSSFAVCPVLDQGHARSGSGHGGRALHPAVDARHGAQSHLFAPH